MDVYVMEMVDVKFYSDGGVSNHVNILKSFILQ